MDNELITKQCRICKLSKSISEFSFRKDSKKYRSECKQCCNEKTKKWRLLNPDKVKMRLIRYNNDPTNIIKRKIWSKQYYEDNREEIIEKVKLWQKTYPDKVNKKMTKWLSNPENKIKKKISAKKYRVNNKDKQQEYFINHYNGDIQFNLAIKLRRRISNAIRNQFTKKAYKTIELLGCSFEEFKKYFQDKFTEGMSWELFMQGKIHIDHITPCSFFNLVDPKQQKICFHYSNLQPLWAEENLIKYTKI